MSDDECGDDVDYYIQPEREETIRADLLNHVEILKEKTINFEDLLNELVRHGCLSFEEKFKILSGIVDENTSNKTLGEKCNELYQTLLVRKKDQIGLGKVLQAWEVTGNSYLVGRFDTHFSLEGRDSKSLKFHKLKALPSYRTEFLTHLHLKQLTLSPKALLKCLRKSSRLVDIRLERIKVPYGGRSSDDPSSDFDQPLILPNLKSFYFEEVSKAEPFKSVKDVNFFLDELNLKPMLFFGLNSNMAWDAGIRIEVRMRGAVLVMIDPAPSSTEEDGEGGRGGHFISMLRRRPVEYGGFINPNRVEKVALYECYLPKAPFCEALRELVIFRCKVSAFDQLLAPCPNLTKVTLYGEAEANNTAQLDLNCFSASKSSLSSLTLGYTSLSFSNFWDNNLAIGLTLESLCLEGCLVKLAGSPDISKIFGKIGKLSLLSVGAGTLGDFVKSGAQIGEISVAEFSWEDVKNSGDEEEDDETTARRIRYEEVVSFLGSELKRGKDCGFNLEGTIISESGSAELEGEEDEVKLGLKDKWIVKKVKVGDPSKISFDLGGFSSFVGESGRKGWFDLPFKSGGGDGEGDEPRKAFRAMHGY